MSESEFLSRWSRLKHAAAKARQAQPQPLPPAEPANLRSTGEGELSAEELARLPRIDELTSETDLTQFLRKGVPQALRNAALRRIWALDPAIRDYVGEARDYAYDWNMPGGVPGSGSLSASDDVPALLRQVIGDGDAAPDRQVGGAAAAPRVPEPAAAPRAVTAAPVREQTAAPDPAKAVGEAVPIQRRHGGATPA